VAYSRGAFYKAFAVLNRYVSGSLPRQAASAEPLTFTDFKIRFAAKDTWTI